jgi:hypothetical protein
MGRPWYCPFRLKLSTGKIVHGCTYHSLAYRSLLRLRHFHYPAQSLLDPIQPLIQNLQPIISLIRCHPTSSLDCSWPQRRLHHPHHPKGHHQIRQRRFVPIKFSHQQRHQQTTYSSRHHIVFSPNQSRPSSGFRDAHINQLIES